MTDSRDDLRNKAETAPELRPNSSARQQAADGSRTEAAAGPDTRRQFVEMTKDEVARIPVLAAGARLEQGSVYLDLDDIESGPFVALGSEEVAAGERFVAKRDADHETWNRLAGDRPARVLRPA